MLLSVSHVHVTCVVESTVREGIFFLLMCRHSKPRILHEAAQPITGLAFKSTGKDVYLFVVTEASVYSINVSNKDLKVGMSWRGRLVEKWRGVG